MKCRAAEATGLGFVLLLSTLHCCQLTELIWAFFVVSQTSILPSQAVCVEAGMIALRRGGKELEHEDYMEVGWWSMLLFLDLYCFLFIIIVIIIIIYLFIILFFFASVFIKEEGKRNPTKKIQG